MTGTTMGFNDGTGRSTHATPPTGRFDAHMLDPLPEPARRWLRRVLPDDTPLFGTAHLEMSGEIRIGRWMPFTADQIIEAGVGFVWRATVGGRVIRFSGADTLTPDQAQTEFRLHGRIPVVAASGPEVARSAAGRLASETVAWLPQATVTADWEPVDDQRAVVILDAAGRRVPVEVTVADDGRLVEVRLDRWNPSMKPPGFAPFGGDITAEYASSAGVRVAGAGLIGWQYGTADWGSGQFFRFVVNQVTHDAESIGTNAEARR